MNYERFFIKLFLTASRLLTVTKNTKPIILAEEFASVLFFET